MNFRDLQSNSARDVAPSGRPSQGDESMAVTNLQPIGEGPNVDAVTRARLELGTSPLEIAAERIEDARPHLIEAMKFLDLHEDARDLHLRLGNEVNTLDDFRALLMERCS